MDASGPQHVSGLQQAPRFKRMAVYATLIGAALYTLVFVDPFISIIMLPFFVLGCARGKHPLTLWALAAVPALLMFVISAVKFTITGVPLVTFDHLFLRWNALLLGYNDWRIGGGIILGIVVTVVYARALFAGRFGGRPAFTRTEKWSVGALAGVALACFASTQLLTHTMMNWNDQLNS
ncbi:MAG: hypothetical protein JNM81_10100, partial [Rhodospirillaceae bacterium]|nr:hypothetical protein [Rhodospirillaceae bacterium]